MAKVSGRRERRGPAWNANGILASDDDYGCAGGPYRRGWDDP